jgi:integrase
VHLARIVEHFGPMPLSAVRPSHVKAWTAKLRAEGLADSYVYALHARLASLLIASGADVKVVQARLRHASAKTTLDTYGHLWPDSDDSTRVAVAAGLANRRERTACGPTAD